MRTFVSGRVCECGAVTEGVDEHFDVCPVCGAEYELEEPRYAGMEDYMGREDR